MLLAIDVGNTQTHIGAFDGDELVEHWRFATDGEDTADELAVRVSSLLSLRGLALDGIDASIVSSVVPRLNPEYARMCEQYLGRACIDGRPRGEDRDAGPARQPARAGRRPACQRGRRLRPLRRRLRGRRLRHRDHLRRGLRRRRVPRRRDRPRGPDLDGGADRARGDGCRRSTSPSRAA